MYAFFRGIVNAKEETALILETAGIGYKIFVPTVLLETCKEGEEATIYTSLIVREGELSLYGFSEQREKLMFEKLIGISGVGPKAAMSILSTLRLNEITQAILSSDTRAFSRVNGIGPKTAGRIVLELKDKVEIEDAIRDTGTFETNQNTPAGEAVEALMGLGYTKNEAIQAVSAVEGLADTAEDLTLLALKHIAM